MKLKDEFSIDVLLDYGFVKINKEEEDDDEAPYIINYDYKFEIGHSRRGQFYYLLVREPDKGIIIYASEADGSNGVINCPDVLIRLSIDGIIVVD